MLPSFIKALKAVFSTTSDKLLGVHTVNIHSIPVNQAFHMHTGVSSTIAVSDVAVDDRTIEIADATLFLAGDKLQFNGGLTIPYFSTIISKAANVLTLDTLVDAIITIGETVEVVETDMAVTASAGSPAYYILEPPAGVIWKIHRIIITMSHGSSGDLGLFGNLTALTNGVVIRARLGGAYGTFSNWKTNGDIKKDMFDVDFDARSGGGGVAGTSGRGSFNRIGVEVELNGDLGDRLIIYVQDDLISLNILEINGQGTIHEPI